MNENYVTLTIGKQKNIALIAHDNKKAELIAYEDLGAEALRRLEVEDMPLFVIIDCEGNNLYEMGRKEYLEAHKED